MPGASASGIYIVPIDNIYYIKVFHRGRKSYCAKSPKGLPSNPMRNNELSALSVSCVQMETKCTRCGRCVVPCSFLQQYGMPGDIARIVRDTPPEEWPDPYECSLCGLCGAVCPEGLKPGKMFLDMRRAKVDVGLLDLKLYRPVLAFEKYGDSNLFSFIRLPEGGDTALFPGCCLQATRSETVRRLFEALQQSIPDIGVALACCMKPSHDLGRQQFFEERFGRLKDTLLAAGVKRVITSCPNCQKVFSEYGSPIKSITAYEILAEAGFSPAKRSMGKAVIHDPCPQRYATGVQDAVRSLVASCGITIEEIAKNRTLTRCCGEGGTVKFIRPDFAEVWTKERHTSAAGRRMVTSCAGCVNYLGGKGEVDHVLDLLLDSKPKKPVKMPFTYIARLLLKRWFRKTLRHL